MKITFESDDCDSLYADLAKRLDEAAEKGVPLAIAMTILDSLIDILKEHSKIPVKDIKVTYPKGVQ